MRTTPPDTCHAPRGHSSRGVGAEVGNGVSHDGPYAGRRHFVVRADALVTSLGARRRGCAGRRVGTRRVRRQVGRGGEAAIVAGGWLVGQLVFFREQWFSGFDRIMGDPGAARFIIYVNENWYQSLLGHASWRTPAFYFPVKNTLGLSDTFLLWQVVYTPARALGADPFLAYQVVLVASSALGFATFYLLDPDTVEAADRARPARGGDLRVLERPLRQRESPPAVRRAADPLGVPPRRRGVARRAAGRTRGALWGAGIRRARRPRPVLDVLRRVLLLLAVVIAALLALHRRAARGTRERRVRSAPRVARPRGTRARRRRCPAILFAVTFVPALHAAGGYKLQSANFFAPQLPDLFNVGLGNLALGHLARRGPSSTGPRRSPSVTTPSRRSCWC